jgi:hypothetical protein
MNILLLKKPLLFYSRAIFPFYQPEQKGNHGNTHN